MPARPAGLEPGRRMGDLDGGILLIGDCGAIMGNCYGESPRIVQVVGDHHDLGGQRLAEGGCLFQRFLHRTDEGFLFQGERLDERLDDPGDSGPQERL